MRPFSPRMFPDLVAVLPLAESQDADLGVVETFPSPGSGLACRIHYQRARAGFAGDSEDSTSSINVAFPSDPGLAKGDRLQPLPSGEVLRVLTAAQPHDADGALFVVRCVSIE